MKESYKITKANKYTFFDVGETFTFDTETFSIVDMYENNWGRGYNGKEELFSDLSCWYEFEQIKKPTIIELLMEKLGVVEGEEFKINESYGSTLFFKNGFLYYLSSLRADAELGQLIVGDIEIIKIPVDTPEEIEIKKIKAEMDKLSDRLEKLTK